MISCCDCVCVPLLPRGIVFVFSFLLQARMYPILRTPQWCHFAHVCCGSRAIALSFVFFEIEQYTGIKETQFVLFLRCNE